MILSRYYRRFLLPKRKKTAFLCKFAANMRKLFLIASLALLCCCGRLKTVSPVLNDTPHRAALDAVDTLLQQQPDSALTALLAFNDAMGDSVLNPWERSRFHLMLAELLYKNDYTQNNRTELLAATAYYDSIAGRHPFDAPLAYLQARAHYMDGVGWYEQDSIMPACQAYLKALQVMENHFKDNEMDRNMIRFMGLINSRLSELFFFNEGYATAIETGKKALFYFLKINDNERAINAYKNIGNCYISISQNDSALFYMNKARKLAENVHLGSYQQILRESTSLYYDIEMTDSAFMMAWQAMNLSATRDDSLTSCYVLGQLFFREQQYDSAIFYLKQSINRNQFSTQLSSAQLLKEAYEALGDMEQAAIYAQPYNEGLEKFLDKASDKTEIVNLYNAYRLQQQDSRHSAWHRKSISRVMLGIGVLLVLLGLLAIYFVRRGRRHAEIMQQENDTLREEKQKVEWEQSKMSGRMRRANEMLKEKDDIIDEKNLENSRLKMRLEQQSADMPSFAEEPVCRLIVERVNEGHFKAKVDYAVYKDSALDKQQLLDLRLAADRHFNQFTVRLKQAYPKLTNSDLDYCCLYLLGLNDADIAALMQRTYNTVFERNGKMRKIFDSEKPLPVTLTAFANEFLSD